MFGSISEERKEGEEEREGHIFINKLFLQF